MLLAGSTSHGIQLGTPGPHGDGDGDGGDGGDGGGGGGGPWQGLWHVAVKTSMRLSAPQLCEWFPLHFTAAHSFGARRVLEGGVAHGMH